MTSSKDPPSSGDRKSGSSVPGMSKTLRDWMIRPSSIWFLLAGFFAILLGVAVVVGSKHFESNKESFLAADRSSANLVALVLQQHERAAVGILQSYSSRPLFVQSVKRKNPENARRHLVDLSKNPEIDLTFVADPRGVRWTSYPVLPEAVGRNLSYRDWYKGVSSHWRPYISEVFKRVTGDQSLAVVICVPVFDEKGRPVGILGNTQRLSNISETIRKVPLSPYTGMTVIDREGQILYSNRYPHQKEIVKHPDLPILEKALPTKGQQMEWFDPQRREKRYLTVAPVEGIGWTVMVERTWKDILRAQSGEMIMAGALAMMMFLLASVFLFYFRKLSRIQKEDELMQAELRFRSLFESMSSGGAVYRAEGDGEDFIIIDFNRAAMRIASVDENVIGKRVTEAFHSVKDFGLFEVFQRVWKTGKAESYPARAYIDNRIAFWTDNHVYKLRSGEIVAIFDDITARVRAEETLRESEENYRLLASTTDSMYLVDRECRYQFVNDMHLSRLGVTFDEIAGRAYGEFHAEAETELFSRDVAQVFETGRPVQSEHLSERDKGWFLRTLSPVKDPDGSVRSVTVVSKDVTARKRAEDALMKNEELYRSFINATSDMAYVKDEQFRHVIANDRLAAFLGRAPEEVIGKTDFELMPEAEAQGCRASDEEALRTKSVIVSEETVLGRIYETTKFLVALREGRTGVGGIIRDVTDRKKAEAALQEIQRQQVALLHNIPDMAWLKDRESRFIAVNEPFAESCGFEVEDLIGKTDLDIWPKDLAERYRENDREVMESGLRKRVEEPLKDNEDRVSWIETIKTPIYDDMGEVTGTVGIARDVTEKRMSLDRLRKALGATIQAMTVAVETRDPYTAGHQRRVADLAHAVATEIGMTPHQIDGIRMAGLIHDVGKLSVPAEILSKPTRLSQIEFSLIKTHVQAGYEILKDIEFPWPIARMVLEHHERMDGSGYPNGLTGDKILMESRILMVADVVEAMASHRPYRPSVGLDTALEEISKNKGILYDSDVVNACLRLFNEKGYQLN
jgi:PAS domain S-box-containing protein/putative nucleotidyltransferase with HDIG domain